MKKHIFVFAVCLTVLVFSPGSADAAVISWNGNGDGISWTDPGNWSAGVPGQEDTARIALAGTYVVILDDSAEVKRLALGGASGTQMLTVVSTIAFLGINGSGVVGVNGVMTLDSSTFHLLGDDVLFLNNGLVRVLDAGIIHVDSSSGFANSPSGRLQLAGGALIDGEPDVSGDRQGLLISDGVIVKTGSGTAQIYLPFENDTLGACSVQVGTLSISASITDNYGIFFIADSAGLTLDATFETPILDNKSTGVIEILDTGQLLTDLTSGLTYISNGGLIKHTGSGVGKLEGQWRQAAAGTLRVEEGILNLIDEWFDITEGMVTIDSLAELDLAVPKLFHATTSELSGSGKLTITDRLSDFRGQVTFTGDLEVTGGRVYFRSEAAPPLSLNSVTVSDSGNLNSSMEITTINAFLNGGETDSDLAATDSLLWTAGIVSSLAAATLTLDPGAGLNVSTGSAKTLDTRDLVIGGGASMSGAGEFSLLNGATVTVAAAGTLTVGAEFLMSDPGALGKLENNGQMFISTGGDSCRFDTYFENLGTARTPGTVDILYGNTLELGLDGYNDGTVNVYDLATVKTEDYFSNEGLFRLFSGAKAVVSDTFDNGVNGTFELSDDSGIDGDGEFENRGDVNKTAGTLRTPGNAVIAPRMRNLAATGLIHVLSDTLTLAGGGSNAGTITIDANTVLVILGIFENEATGVINGTGTLDVSGATFTNNGTIAPGVSPGIFAVDGNLVFGSTGVLSIELGGVAPGTEYDQLIVSGSIALDGTLSVALINGFIPSIGETFDILSYASHSGEFAEIEGMALGDGRFLNFDFGANGVSSSVCDGIAEISVSTGTVQDTVMEGMADTDTLQICNAGVCPLEWSIEFVQFTPDTAGNPFWLTLGGVTAGLLFTTECAEILLNFDTQGLALDTYTGELVIQSNDSSGNDSLVIPVNLTVVSPLALSGTYDLGGGGLNYADFSSAVSDLNNYGISGPVTFNVFSGTYNESISITEIAGASAVNTIAFNAVGGAAGLVGPTAPALRLNGADYIQFRDIDFSASVAGNIVEVWNNADNNLFSGGGVQGSGFSASTSGINIGEGDNNIFELMTVDNSDYPFFVAGDGANPGMNNEIRNCTIPGGIQGITVGWQEGIRIHGNDIQPGWAGSGAYVYGVFVGNMNAGDSCFIYNNEIHNFRTTSKSWGIIVESELGYTQVHNNFLYGFTGGTYSRALSQLSGEVGFYFNSVRIPNGVSTGMQIGAHVSSGPIELKNNIFQLDDLDALCWGIFLDDGATLVASDHNCFFGTSPSYSLGHDGGSYADLAAWQAATGQDANSVEGDPGFISGTDLHIDSTFSLVDAAGITVPGITTDIDDEPRGDPPDIGADEYDFIPDAIDDLVINVVPADDVILHWSPVVSAQNYFIYSNSGIPVDTIPGNLLGSTADTTFTHSGAISGDEIRFYIVTASAIPPAPPAPSSLVKPRNPVKPENRHW